MARNSGTLVENDLSGGLNSEATALTFPANAVAETYNCIFHPDKRVTRRTGIDFENDSVPWSLGPGAQFSWAIGSYLWRSAGPNGNTNILVTQQGPFLYFYISDGTPLGPNRIDQVANLDNFKVSGAPDPYYTLCEFDSGRGYLFVTHPYCEPFFINYNGVDFDTGVINVTVRDVEGIDDELAINARPSTLTDAHHYNLLNQGWGDVPMYSNGGTSTLENIVTGLNAIDVWHLKRPADYPSNADVWYTLQSPAYGVTGSVYPYVFRPDTIGDGVPVGTSKAPRGRFTSSAWYFDRPAVSGISGLPIDTSYYLRPSTVAFFAGRVFFSGVRAEGYNHKIFFSRIIESYRDFGQCLTDNDPTSQNNTDSLPSDGGVIAIHDIGNIYRLFAVENNLLVFGSNGIFMITGSSGLGFTATDYAVIKISTMSITDNISYVDVGGIPVFWNVEGIFTVVGNDKGTLTLQNISESSLKRFFASIPSVSKLWAKGAYDPYTRCIRWLYNSFGDPSSFYDRVLSYNIDTKAWYVWSLWPPSTLTNPRIASIVTVESNTIPVMKYVVIYQTEAGLFSRFADFERPYYKDWLSTAAVNYDSYFITGYRVHGEGNKKFQTNFVNFYFEATPDIDGFVSVSGIWDFAININENKYTREQIIPIPIGSRSNTVKRIRIPGNGKSLQIKVSSIENTPFTCVGWSIWETGGVKP